MRDTFHQATIAHKDVGVVVNDLVAALVELGSERTLSNRHTNRIGDALAKRTGSGLNAWRIAILRMTRSLGVELTEISQIINREIISGQVQ